MTYVLSIFFFQAEDGIRDYKVTGVQTCALPIWIARRPEPRVQLDRRGAGGSGGPAAFQCRGDLFGARLELDGLCACGRDAHDDQRAGQEGPHACLIPAVCTESVMICQGRGTACPCPYACRIGPACLY